MAEDQKSSLGTDKKEDENCNVEVKYRAHEYAESVRIWMLQQQFAAQMSWYMNVTMPMVAMNCAALNCAALANRHSANTSVLGTSASTSSAQAAQPARTSSNTATESTEQRQQEQHPFAREWVVPPVWRRVMAEFIDFMFLFTAKLGMSLVTLEFTDLFDIERPDLENLLTDWDPNIALAITVELLAMEILNRILVCVFETLCLWRGVGGATPGKRVMCLKVVSCHEVYGGAGERVRIIPAGNLSFNNALVRSVIKNFSLAFVFPLCFTVFLSPHKRASYDLLAGSIVVEDDVRPWPPHIR